MTVIHVPQQTEIDFAKQAMLKGVERAEAHANRVHNGWSEEAFMFLKIFLRHRKDDFMVEDIRSACKGVVPDPPSSRAWGAVILRAAKSGLVKKVGIRAVKNMIAHRANAAVWKRVSPS